MKTAFFALAILTLSGAAVAFQKEAQKSAAKPVLSDAQVIAAQLPSYPLEVCPISKEKLGGEMGAPVDVVREGRLVRFCCEKCVKAFEKDPAPTLKKIDEAVIKAQKADYPLTTCPVSGKALTADAIDHVEGTRLVRFCCAKCPEAFAQDPAKYMAQVDQALIAAQKKTYALTTCPVSGEPLGDDAVDSLYGTRLVRFCCAKCTKAFTAEPAKYLPKLLNAKKPANAASPLEKKGG